MVRYEYYEPNEKVKKKSDKRGDCVVRAMCKAFDMKWLDVFDELIVLSRELQEMPSVDRVWKRYIKEKGCAYIPIKATKGSRRPTVRSFANEHKKGTYILFVAHHVVTVKDGIYYDTWDSGNRSLYAYWIVKGNKKEEQKKELDRILEKENISPGELLKKLKKSR